MPRFSPLQQPFPRPMLTGPAAGGGLSKPAALAVVVVAALLAVAATRTDRVLSNVEARTILAARAMANGGGLWQVSAYDVYWDQSPLEVWPMAMLFFVTGSESAAVARLPAQLMFVALALATALFVARWFGSRTGLTAGLMSASLPCVLLACDRLTVEMYWTAGTTAALMCFALSQVESQRDWITGPWPAIGFFAACGGLLLLVGWTGPLLAVSIAAVYLVSSHERRGLQFFAAPLAIGLFLLLAIGAWGLATVRQVSNESEFLISMGLPPVGWNEAKFRSAEIFCYTLPWLPLAVCGIRHGLCQGLHVTPFWRFLSCWIIIGLIANLAFATPLACAAPPLAIFASAALMRRVRTSLGVQVWQRHAFSVLSLLVATGCFVGLWQAGQLPVAAAIVTPIAVAVLFYNHLEQRRWVVPQLATLLAAGGIVSYASLALYPAHQLTAVRDHAAAVELAAKIPPGERVYTTHFPGWARTFYLDRRLHLVDADHRTDEQSGTAYYLNAPFYPTAKDQLELAMDYDGVNIWTVRYPQPPSHLARETPEEPSLR